MEEANEQCSAIRSVLEDSERHDRILRKLPLPDEEEGQAYHAENNEANDGCGVPGISDAAKFKTEEEHESATDD